MKFAGKQLNNMDMYFDFNEIIFERKNVTTDTYAVWKNANLLGLFLFRSQNILQCMKIQSIVRQRN